MSALDTAKELGREAVLEKIKEAGLMEYGLNRGPLLERLESTVRKSPCRSEQRRYG